jgi:hypothetical protein
VNISFAKAPLLDAAEATDEAADATFFFVFFPMSLAALSEGIWKVPIAVNVSSSSNLLGSA